MLRCQIFFIEYKNTFLLQISNHIDRYTFCISILFTLKRELQIKTLNDFLSFAGLVNVFLLTNGKRSSCWKKYKKQMRKQVFKVFSVEYLEEIRDIVNWEKNNLSLPSRETYNGSCFSCWKMVWVRYYNHNVMCAFAWGTKWTKNWVIL